MVKIDLNSETVKLGIDIWYVDTPDFESDVDCSYGKADYICPMPHKHCGWCD